MKVKELIEQLSKLDPELMVIVDGYEGGVTEASYADVETIALDVHSEWYYGPHEKVDDIDKYEGHARTQAVRIY